MQRKSKSISSFNSKAILLQTSARIDAWLNSSSLETQMVLCPDSGFSICTYLEGGGVVGRRQLAVEEGGGSGGEAHLVLEVGLPGAQMAAAEAAEQAEVCSRGLQAPFKRKPRRIIRLDFKKRKKESKSKSQNRKCIWRPRAAMPWECRKMEE